MLTLLTLYFTACTVILSSMTLAQAFLRGSLQLLWSGRLAIPQDMLCDQAMIIPLASAGAGAWQIAIHNLHTGDQEFYLSSAHQV